MNQGEKLKNRREKLSNMLSWAIFVVIFAAVVLTIGYLGRNFGSIQSGNTAVPRHAR